MLSATSRVPLAAASTPLAMLWVAAPCCSTAEEIDGGDLADALDRQPDRFVRADGFSGGALHVDNVRADLVGGFRGLASQGLDLLRHHSKSTAGVAGPCGLDGRVEGKQIGLFRNRRDQ